MPLVYKAGGRWNTYEITARGPQLTVKLNGVQTVSMQDRKHAAGPIALQYGAGVRGAPGGPIKWRRVQIRPLSQLRISATAVATRSAPTCTSSTDHRPLA